MYVHEWLIQDILDKKLLSDSIHANQQVADIQQQSGLEVSNYEKLLKFGIQNSTKFANLLLTLP